mgnify:CR=1 FL=1
MKALITGACGHIGSFLAENIHKIKKKIHHTAASNNRSQRS